MDPVTHTLAGITLSNFFLKRKPFLWIVVISSVLPDIDYVTGLWGTDVFLRYHRGITHGIVALFLVPFFLAALYRTFYGRGFMSYFTFAFIGYGLHLAIDLIDQYGTRVLAPLDWNQYSMGLTFVIDPLVSISLIIAVLMTKVFRKRPVFISIIVLVILAGYIGGRFVLKNSAEALLREQIEHREISLSPLPNDCLRWWYVARTIDKIKVGSVDLFTKEISVHHDLIYSDYDPAIVLSKENRVVKNFLYYARFPFPSVYSKDGYTLVEWRELLYSFIPGRHFVAWVVFDENANAVSSSFTF